MASNTSNKARYSLQTAFEAGRVGFKKNMVNPFNIRSDLYKEWARPWTSGCAG